MEIALKEFLEDYSESLKKKVIDGFKPLFNPGQKDFWDREAELRLEQLKRKPFPAQTRSVLALAKGFFVEEKRGLILVSEMGTGKTEMAIAVAHLIPKLNPRVLVMCPPHLVRKWIREIEETMPRCRTININGKSLKEIEEMRRKTRPTCPEFYVIGRERAKNHYQIVKAFVRQKRLDRDVCPDCGKILDGLRSRRPKCPGCEQPLYQADKDGIRRFAKAEYIKKFLKGKFDLFIADEMHECKGGTTAQGQAFADLACSASYTLALTGTLVGGYATNLFYILWRLMPGQMKAKGINFHSPIGFAESYGVIQRTLVRTLDEEYTSASIGRSRGVRTIVSEKPGLSPMILSDFLLDHAVFMRLSDVSKVLPALDETVVEIAMTDDQRDAYLEFENTLRNAVKQALARKDPSLLGALVNSLLAYPDGARKGEVVFHPHSQELIASGPPINEYFLPKENKLLDLLQQELSEGRKCLVCLEHTGTRDLIVDLRIRAEERGFKPLILRSGTVSTEKREAWVRSRMETGEFDLMITNPNLIKTGLDLIEFPTIIFFQTGYSIYTLRQASRRSWRIGQKQPVKVYYLSYAETMQSIALSLIAAKMEASLAIEGDLSDKGLAALAESSNSMLIEMARTLLNENSVQPVSEAWKGYKKKEVFSDSFIGDDAETETTTTTITKGDHSGRFTCEVIRGKVYPQQGYAVGYVGPHKFFFKAGRILFNGRLCGSYDKTGIGMIKDKQIKIKRVPDLGYYFLVELR